MIKTFDRQACRDVRKELDLALAELGKKLGLSIKSGRGSFTPTDLTIKVECAVIGDGGEVMNKEATEFKQYAKSYGLEPTDLGKKFPFRHDEYTIVGLKGRSYKFPILAKRSDGKIFKFPSKDVLRYLGRHEVAQQVKAHYEAGINGKLGGMSDDDNGESGVWEAMD